jgi:hypothetical protein
MFSFNQVPASRFLKPASCADLFWETSMFDVKWVAQQNEASPIDSENSVLQNLDVVVWHCISRLPLMREEFAHCPPDGFLVFNHEGREVRRWFGSTARIDA